MESVIGVVAIIVTDYQAVEKVNSVLHDFRDYVIGRMGVPYKEKNVNVISVVLDAPCETLNGLAGKLGMIKGVKSKLLVAGACK
ncbi:MAG: TM1266 family iron-only hydrogenase system putative regulator [Candidatus Borkfalkiaceae bacterium]|nr:TM1266 family iron-only hydrogenase system putative regulator [Christensenellaceae bacterium]